MSPSLLSLQKNAKDENRRRRGGDRENNDVEEVSIDVHEKNTQAEKQGCTTKGGEGAF